MFDHLLTKTEKALIRKERSPEGFEKKTKSYNFIGAITLNSRWGKHAQIFSQHGRPRI